MTGVTNYNDTIYTRNETMLGSWTYDKDGILRYHPLDTVPPEIRFTPPPVEIPFTLPKLGFVKIRQSMEVGKINHEPLSTHRPENILQS